MKKYKQEAKIVFDRLTRKKELKHVKDLVNDVLQTLKNQLKYNRLIKNIK